jgi:serine/threonine protein kinase
MRTTRTVTSLQKSVSPHISSSVRKTMIHDRHSNNNSNDHDHDHAQDSKMGMSPEFAASKADSNSIATSATEHSSPFFADATFEMKSSSPIDVEYLKRTERILRFAQKRLKKSCSEDFFERKQKKSTQPQEILHVQHSDVELDAIVGNGSYNIVYSVKRIKGSNTNRSSSQSNLQFEPENVVVKTLRPKLLTDLPMLAACAADLRKEGFLLAGLQQQQDREHHDHIVKVLAWVPSGLSAFANGCHDSFFLVLEKLDRTLTDVIREWKLLEAEENDNDTKQLQEQQRGGFRNNFRRNCSSGKNSSRRSLFLSSVKNSFFRVSQKQLQQQQQKPQEASASLSESKGDESSSELLSNSNDLNSPHSHSKGADPDRVQFWKMRLSLLVDLAGAIAFLHSHRVIHRDLKPDNVGFDKLGKPKVFDFDVARILPNQANWGRGDYNTSIKINETFKMTKNVGSPRYMSPECARGEYYNEKADVYALGLLAYEILSLKRPFDVRSSSSDERKKGGKNNSNNCVYKDCVKVVVRGEDGNHEDDDEEPRSRGIFQRKKRRNSFPFKKQYTNKSGGGSSSGKLGGIFFRRRCSGSHKNNNSNSNRRNPSKYATIRPLLPVATQHELVMQQQQQHAARNKTNTQSKSYKTGNSSTSRKSQQQQEQPQQHYHSVNDVDVETLSFYWTRSLRCTIDRAWSYDIPTRPFAYELKVLLGEELIQMDWHEEE